MVFTDLGLRTVHGLKLSIKEAKVGDVEAIQGQRKYKLALGKNDAGVFYGLFPMEQSQIPLSIAVFPPGIIETEVLIAPGKYSVRSCPHPKNGKRSEFEFSENISFEIELGEDLTVHLK